MKYTESIITPASVKIEKGPGSSVTTHYGHKSPWKHLVAGRNPVLAKKKAIPIIDMLVKNDITEAITIK